ncbi:MAG: tetratricopeptide repeat protein [Planctomycetota bacterium]
MNKLLRNLVLLLVLPASVAANADEVRVGRLPYSGVTVTDFAGGELTFRTSGREITRSLSEVNRIELDGRGQFNRAEEFLADDRYGEAVQAYRGAEESAGSAWLGRLISCRLIAAFDGAGRFDDAVQQWVSAVSANDHAEEVLNMRPSNIPEKGDAANSRAIDLLEIRVDRVENDAFRRSIRELLLELYRREDRHEQAAELAEQLGERPEQPREESQAPRTAQREQSGGLGDIRGLLEQGDPDKALQFVEARMGRLDDAELPEALLLAGRARMELYEDRGDRQDLLKAGLDFMRVATFHGGSDWGPEALYRAGEVNKKLDNASATRAAWQMVIARYGDSEYAEKAAEGIEQLRKKTPRSEAVPADAAVEHEEAAGT